MNSQRIEQSLRQILEQCGEEILQNHNAFQSAVFDLLDKIKYANEQLILKHAMESNAFWMLLEAQQVTADTAKRAAAQIQNESRMTKEDAELVVRCVAAARGGKTGSVIQKPAKPESFVSKPANRQKSGLDYKNTLMKDCPDANQTGGTVLESKISRDSIVSVTFVNTLKAMPTAAWDVSWNRDGSVIAWTEQSGKDEKMLDLFIGAEGGVKGRDCRGLFEYYQNVETIDFNRSFDTSQATDMSLMFSKCGKLEKLDVSSFDTSQVTDMSRMFVCCGKLERLDVSSFDTSQVTRMKSMFMSCVNLTSLNVSKFDTSRVTDMSFMFLGCGKLAKLDVSGFDIGQVTDMGWMFERCGVTAKEAGLKLR